MPPLVSVLASTAHTVLARANRAPVVVLTCVVLVASACGSSEPGGSEEPLVVIETRSGAVEFEVEVAKTREERQLGLMGRNSLPENAGMLFLYDEPASRAFTMRNTLIPLSIAFMDGDGRILRILRMEPCESGLCPSYNSELPFSSALEVNQGAFEDLGVQVGDIARLEG